MPQIMDLDGVQFASLTFGAGTSNSDHCGANGLPVTPCSITMVGNYKALLEPVRHPHLVQYLDCYRSKHEKVTLVFEHYSQEINRTKAEEMVSHLLLGLHHLHYEVNAVHGNITPECVLLSGKHYKLTHWGLNVLTNNGNLLDADALLPHDMAFIAPERTVRLSQAPAKKCDVWSLALVVATLLFPETRIPVEATTLVSCQSPEQVLEELNLTQLPEKWVPFFTNALQPLISKRANVKRLLDIMGVKAPKTQLSFLDSLINFDKLTLNLDKPRKALNVRETYHLLTVACPGHREVAKTEGRSDPPVVGLPLVVTPENPSVVPSTINQLSNYSVVPRNLRLLPMETFKCRLNQLHPNIFYPLIVTSTPSSQPSDAGPLLPLIIRENDFTYQCERTVLFKSLVEGVPYVRPHLLNAAKVDIAPFYRAQTWASILNVKWSQLLLYERIDKLNTTSTDRQISVDIPRCHQYNDLLASPQGHLKLTRILKAWLCHNDPEYVYWQGLDSLAAPFVILNFNNEAVAFACFNAFIHKYLQGFFSRDNSATIQEYLALFSHLIAFHEPLLFNHLDELGFTPELYAIPWFLTMFTHVLPLHKIVHVWDTLLLGNESFPLYIGLSILIQLKSQLLGYTFNDCILIFSDLPEIHIETSVKEAIRLFCSTPKSLTQRGLVPVDELRRELCPRIVVQDLVDLSKSNTKYLILDMRSPEDVSKYGSISGAIMDGKAYLREFTTVGQLVIVVNDISFAAELIKDNVSRVCCLIYYDFIPKELCD